MEEVLGGAAAGQGRRSRVEFTHIYTTTVFHQFISRAEQEIFREVQLVLISFMFY